MKAVGLKVLKNRLSEYVRMAAAGETILVTDRDHVVAQIGPPSPNRSPEITDALLAEAVRKGWVKTPALANAGVPPRLPATTFRKLMHELERDREDR